MTITRLWQSGAEFANDLFEVDGSSGTNHMDPDTVNPRTGSYAYAVNIYYTRYVWKNIPATRQIRMGWWWYHSANVIGNEAGICLSIAEADQTPIIYAGWGTSAPVLSGDIDLYVNGSWSGPSTNHLLYPQAWTHVGLDIKVDSSAGWADIYLNGVQALSVTGNTGNVDIGRIVMGSLDRYYTAGSNTYWDDIYIDDTTGESEAGTAPPHLRFDFVTPDGNGNYSQWTGSDGDSTDNYLLVDEYPSSTDYVEVGSADQYDSYTMTTFTLGTNQTIEAVIPTATVKRQGSTEQIALGTRYSSTDVVGSDQDVPNSYKARFERQTTKPGGGAWDQSSLDGFELVVKSRGSY